MSGQLTAGRCWALLVLRVCRAPHRCVDGRPRGSSQRVSDSPLQLAVQPEEVSVEVDVDVRAAQDATSRRKLCPPLA